MGLFINILISLIGQVFLAYFIYGKNITDFNFMIFGVLLMVYPYFISDLIGSLVIGTIFLIGPFITRKFF